MEKLVDESLLQEKLALIPMEERTFRRTVEELENAPTVEVIIKADYKNRLKADMVAMLTEIQMEIDELPNHELQNSNWKSGFTHGLADVQEKVIQQKIDKLKEVDL